MQLNVEWSIR